MKFAILLVFLAFASWCQAQNTTCYGGDSRQILNTIQCERGCALTKKRSILGEDHYESECQTLFYPCWLFDHTCCQGNLCNMPPNGLLKPDNTQ